jgi:hypothetical protein
MIPATVISNHIAPLPLLMSALSCFCSSFSSLISLQIISKVTSVADFFSHNYLAVVGTEVEVTNGFSAKAM